jgi:hypothetical protein
MNRQQKACFKTVLLLPTEWVLDEMYRLVLCYTWCMVAPDPLQCSYQILLAWRQDHESLALAFQPSGPAVQASWNKGVSVISTWGRKQRHLFSLGQRDTASESGGTFQNPLLPWSATTNHIWILYAYNKVLTLTLYMQHHYKTRKCFKTSICIQFNV